MDEPDVLKSSEGAEQHYCTSGVWGNCPKGLTGGGRREGMSYGEMSDPKGQELDKERETNCGARGIYGQYWKTSYRFHWPRLTLKRRTSLAVN